MINKKKNYYSKCDFCKYFSGRSCTATENYYYCHDALQEFYTFLAEKKRQKQLKADYTNYRGRN